MAKEKEKETTAKAISLKTLTKSTVWDVQENDIFRMLEAGDKDSELRIICATMPTSSGVPLR